MNYLNLDTDKNIMRDAECPKALALVKSLFLFFFILCLLGKMVHSFALRQVKEIISLQNLINYLKEYEFWIYSVSCSGQYHSVWHGYVVVFIIASLQDQSYTLCWRQTGRESTFKDLFPCGCRRFLIRSQRVITKQARSSSTWSEPEFTQRQRRLALQLQWQCMCVH